jgi:hypothetical protein
MPPKKITFVSRTLVETNYVGPTNTKGARIKVKNYKTGKTTFHSYTYEHDNHESHAVVASEALNTSNLFCCENGGAGFFWMSVN